MNTEKYFFLLGGQDLEMLAIRELLREHGVELRDKQLGWGARASAYSEELARTRKTPVLVELENDLGLDESEIVVVDHHGERAGANEPTSLEQVWRLLALDPGRWDAHREYQLIAANDRGHIDAMAAMGATAEEIRDIRARDRRAQGVTQDEEHQARAAVAAARMLADGRLTVVELPHGKTAPVTDRLHEALGGPGYENLLILSPDETNFYGQGRLVNALRARYPGGWSGGDLPDKGFWGIDQRVDDNEPIAFLESALAAEGD